MTTSSTGTQTQCWFTADDPARRWQTSLCFIVVGHRDAGQDDDVLSTLFFRGKNDNATPEENFAAIEASIVDATTTEDGRLRLQVQTAGTLTTQLEISGANIGSYGATAVSTKR